MSKKKLRVGIIGCGRFSEPGHALHYKLNPRCEFVAVCDTREEQARKLASRFGVKQVFSDAEEMLDRAGLDAVSVCTPTFTHADLVCAAASRGIHVMCEKPFSISPEEGARMVNACAENKVALHVGFHQRYDRGIARARELAAGGEYGACFHAEFRWKGLSTMGNVPAINNALNLARRAGMSMEGFSPDWRFSDPRIPGGILEVFCHSIDLAVWMFGVPDSVEGSSRMVSPDARKPEHSVALLKYNNGPVVFLTMSSRALALWETQDARFLCEDGNVMYETNSNLQSLIPARVTVETGRGLFGSRGSVFIPPDLSPLRNIPHYRKIDNFLLDALGELPPEEEPFIARGEAGMKADAIIEKIRGNQ
ncbi:MAG: Gfo/Idh/MocA family oxidoreductase [bacterium]